MNFYQRIGRRGVGLLRIAILEVLHESDECLGVAEICRRAGIFREPGYARKQGNDDIGWGVISSLVKTGHIIKCTQGNNKGGWMLSPDFRSERDRIMDASNNWGGDRKFSQVLHTRQYGLCVACLCPLTVDTHVDHIHPKSLGGSDDHVNKQLLCASCNMSRGAKPFDEWLAERYIDVPWADFDP